MNVDEIKERTNKLRALFEAEADKDPTVNAAVTIGLELLEGFLINMSNATYFLEELQVMELHKRSQ